MDPLTEEEKEPYKNQELCHLCTNNNEEMGKIIIVTIQGNIEALHIVSVI